MREQRVHGASQERLFTGAGSQTTHRCFWSTVTATCEGQEAGSAPAQEEEGVCSAEHGDLCSKFCSIVLS